MSVYTWWNSFQLSNKHTGKSPLHPQTNNSILCKAIRKLHKIWTIVFTIQYHRISRYPMLEFLNFDRGFKSLHFNKCLNLLISISKTLMLMNGNKHEKCVFVFSICVAIYSEYIASYCIEKNVWTCRTVLISGSQYITIIVSQRTLSCTASGVWSANDASAIAIFQT